MTRSIVICGVNYAPEFTGVGRYTGEIAEFMADQGDSVCVVTTPPHYPGWAVSSEYSNRGWRRETREGVEVYRCPVFLDRRMRGFKRFLSPLSYAMSSAPVALWQILRRRPQVVMVVEPTLLAAPMALLGAALVGAKTVLHVQDLEVDAAFAVGHLKRRGLTPLIAEMFERAVMRSFDRIITISDRMAEKIRAKGVAGGRIAVIRNWVNLGAFKRTHDAAAYRRELALAPDDFIVLYAGALGGKQGVQILVETARLLADTPELSIVVAGEGPERTKLEAAAADLTNMKVFGFQPEARFAEFLKMADAHVLPQERDAADLLLPSKLGGMLASGRPILVTAEAETELATFLGTSCIFTPPGDAPALAEAIRCMVKAEEDSDAQRARLDRAELLSRDSAIRRLYEEAFFISPDRTTDAARAPTTHWEGSPG